MLFSSENRWHHNFQPCTRLRSPAWDCPRIHEMQLSTMCITVEKVWSTRNKHVWKVCLNSILMFQKYNITRFSRVKIAVPSRRLSAYQRDPPVEKGPFVMKGAAEERARASARYQWSGGVSGPNVNCHIEMNISHGRATGLSLQHPIFHHMIRPTVPTVAW